MPRNDDTIAVVLARRLARRLAELRPETTSADLLRAAVEAGPVAFARDVLHVWLSRDQRRIVEAAASRKRLAIASGHKLGKSLVCAVLALWFYCRGARVILMAPGARQIDGIIWREIKRLVRSAAIPIPGGPDIGVRPSTGLTDPITLAEIRGYTGNKIEAVAGTSGAMIVYIIDEASGVDAEIFTAVEGNRAGGNAWVILISNPTRATGEFYDAHHSKSELALGEGVGYWALQIHSWDSPNCTGEWREMQEWHETEWRPRTCPIPGIADPAWVEEKRREWGEDSADWLIRVAGGFAVAEELKIFPAGLILEAEQRWEDADIEGPLVIGVDPAGDGNRGDRSAFAPRRGKKVLELVARRGLSPEQHCAIVDDLHATHAPKGLPTIVNVDAEGEAGYKVYVALRSHAERSAGRIIVHRIRSSSIAVRQPLIYHLLRDELFAVARVWMRQGGAIPTDAKLSRELHAAEWYCDLKGRQKATRKDDLIDMLGCSPDLADAVILSCWEGAAYRAAAGAEPPRQEASTDTNESFSPWDDGGVDPFSGMINPWS